MKYPLLSLNQVDLHVPSRSTPILNQLSLEVYEGDFIVVLGSNGSGKSSLVRAINGVCQIGSGSISLKGKNLSSESIAKRAQSIVTLSQDLNLSTFSELTVLENCVIAMARRNKRALSLPSSQERNEMGEYLSLYNPHLTHQMDEKVSSLSGGERQTLALAISFWNVPDLLLLDEHTSALDPHRSKTLMELTHKEAVQKGITTLMTTHNLEDASLYGNRLILMKEGRVEFDMRGEDKTRLTREDLFKFYK